MSVGSNKPQETAAAVSKVAKISIKILGVRSHCRAPTFPHPHVCRRCRITEIQLIPSIRSDSPAIGQRSVPSGEIALLTPLLSPMPASNIGRMQHEQAAKMAPTLLSMLKTVVLTPPG